jgi:16S rRNA (guanine(966)-N(2))-methyltransferase RsmD
MDRMRESVFAALGDVTDVSFLDLFSGSGVIALEAASRGAAFIEAVESDPLKRKTLLRNVSISPVRIACRFMSAELYIKRAKKRFDIIFLDPPFPYRYKWQLIESMIPTCLVSLESKIVIHRPREDSPSGLSCNLHRIDSREYGRSIVDFFSIEP